MVQLHRTRVVKGGHHGGTFRKARLPIVNIYWYTTVPTTLSPFCTCNIISPLLLTTPLLSFADSGVILDRVSFHGRFVHFHLPSFLPSTMPCPLALYRGCLCAPWVNAVHHPVYCCSSCCPLAPEVQRNSFSSLWRKRWTYCHPPTAR